MTNRTFLPLALVVGLSVAVPGCGASSEPLLRELLLRSMIKAAPWLDTIEFNPGQLRRFGIKGKKKTVELFEAYTAIAPRLPPQLRPSLELRLRKIARITEEASFHDMGAIPAEQFAEDATSYLRFCYLLEKSGFETTAYRQEIRAILPRLNAHLSSRGVNQQLAFAVYYRFFGIEPPFDLRAAYRAGIIQARPDASALDTLEVYALTHEVLALAGFGDDSLSELLSESDAQYLDSVLSDLAAAYIGKRDPDLVAELLLCMELLKMRTATIIPQGVKFLLSCQNPNGSFGDYERLRALYGRRVDEGFYLHTTCVVLKALALFQARQER